MQTQHCKPLSKNLSSEAQSPLTFHVLSWNCLHWLASSSVYAAVQIKAHLNAFEKSLTFSLAFQQKDWSCCHIVAITITWEQIRKILCLCTLRSCFFRWDISVIFLSRHFGHWDISVICLTVVFKLAVAVFINLFFQIFWPKWFNFFGHFKKISVYDRKKQLRRIHSCWSQSIRLKRRTTVSVMLPYAMLS